MYIQNGLLKFWRFERMEKGGLRSQTLVFDMHLVITGRKWKKGKIKEAGEEK